MKKILFSEYFLFVHTVLTYLLSSSLSLVWYLNYFSVLTGAVIFVELFIIKKWRLGREWLWFFVPLGLLALMAMVAGVLDPRTLHVSVKVAYAYILALMYYCVVLKTGRTWFLVWGLFVSLGYIYVSQGLGASLLALEFGERADLNIGGFGKTDALNSNVYALICVFCFAFAMFQFFEANRIFSNKFTGFIARVVSVVVSLVSIQQILVVSGSRKGMVLLVFWFFVTGVLSLRGRVSVARAFVGGLCGFALLVVGLVALYFSPFYWRIEEVLYGLTGQVTQESSYLGRVELAKLGLELWLSNPVFGHFMGAAIAFGKYSHSNPVELLINHGIIGFALYYSYYIIYLKKVFLPCVGSAHPIIRSHAVFIGAFFVMFFLWEFAAVNYYLRYSFPVVGVLLGLSVYDLRSAKQMRMGQMPNVR